MTHNSSRPPGHPHLMDGADCARRDRPVTVNPYAFDTADHYRWLADWHDAKACAHRIGTPARAKLEALAAIYRRQAAAVSLTDTYGER